MATKSAFTCLLFALLIFRLQGCKEPETPGYVCSCSGLDMKPFTDERAIVVNTTNGFQLLSPTVGYINPCEQISPNHSMDALLVILSGKSLATCDKTNDTYKNQKETFSSLSSIAITTDSSFHSTEFDIDIINSQDYGYGPGYGYRIQHGSFKIFQPTIPAIGGLVTFESEADAYKTAVLVTYLLNLDIGLPSLTIEDLEYLKVVK